MSDWHDLDQNNHLRSVPIRRGRGEFQPRQFFIAAGIAVLIVVIIAAAVWSDKPRAKSAAGALPTAAGTITPTASKPGPPVTKAKPVEVSPPIAEKIAGDGQWLVGKQIKRGVYRTVGDAPSCYWAIRSNLSYDYDATVVSSYGRRGVQTVALGPNARVFISYGCRWQWVKP